MTKAKTREFFKKSDSSYGIFYPRDYIIAVLDSYNVALRAEKKLQEAGYGDDEVDAVPCSEVIEDIKTNREDASWLNKLKQNFSVGMEKAYWQEDLRLAQEGKGFLAVYCPTDHEADRVVRLLQSEKPLSVRRYKNLVIERLV